MWGKIVLLALVITSLSVSIALAQTELGSIKGYVQDVEGRAIIGATVRATSPALMGVRETVSGANGFYRLINLDAGTYVLVAEKEGYSKFQQEELLVKTGLTISVNVTLQVGSFEQVITVTATTPMLEVEQPVKAWNFDGEFLRSLPISPQKNWNDVMSMVPGAYMAYGGNELVEVHGASYHSNVPLLDGVHVGSVQSNYLGNAYLPVESISDIQVVAGFAGAAKPAGTGSYINIVTKSGGDEFHGESSFDLQLPSWNGVNTEGGSPLDQTIYRSSFSIGGPIVKDKTWFFSSLRYTHTKSGIYRTPEIIANLKAFDPGFEPFDRTSKEMAWQNKITHQLTDKVQVVFNYLYNTDRVANSANMYETESGARGQIYGGPMYSGQVRWNISDNANLQALFGWKEGGFKTRPQGGTGPMVRWYRSTYLSGGRIYGRDLLASTGNISGWNHGKHDRATLSADFEYYIDNLKGSHELKMGTFMQPTVRDFMDMYSSNDGFIQEYRVLNDPNNPSAGYKVFYQRHETPTVLTGKMYTTRQYDYYVSDTWRPTDRLVINFGFKASQGVTIDTFGNKNQDGWGFAPSIGATYQITGDGQNILRGGWSSNYEALVNIGMFSRGSYSKGYTMLYDTDMDGTWDSTLSRAPILEPPPPNPLYQPDPNLTQPYTDEISLGFQRQLPWRVTIDLAYYHREIKNQIGRRDTNGIYENGSLVGVKDGNYGLIYTSTNVEAFKFVYDGFEINLHKNLSDNMQFLLGYSYSRTTTAGQYHESDPAFYLQPETFPNSRGFGRTVNYASMYLDAYRISYYNSGVTPHAFKAAATYFGPLGINFGANLVWQTGKWQGAIMDMIPSSEVPYPTYVTLPNGSRVSNPIATRWRFVGSTRTEGQSRAPAFTYVNLRAAKMFNLGKYRVEAAANIFNLFNRGEDMYYYYGANQKTNYRFGQTYGRQSPRAGQLNIRFIY